MHLDLKSNPSPSIALVSDIFKTLKNSFIFYYTKRPTSSQSAKGMDEKDHLKRKGRRVKERVKIISNLLNIKFNDYNEVIKSKKCFQNNWKFKFLK